MAATGGQRATIVDRPRGKSLLLAATRKAYGDALGPAFGCECRNWRRLAKTPKRRFKSHVAMFREHQQYRSFGASSFVGQMRAPFQLPCPSGPVSA
jgi:hypothetical protein